MKTKLAILCLLTTALCPLARAQGTALTYQGRLNDGANLANGIYDLRFTVHAASSGGSASSGPLTNAATAVSNGLFTVTLDFGAGVFTGPDRWLEIGVRTNGVGSFTALAPRQVLTPTPYAIYAKGASASGITGTLPSSILNGIYSNPLTLNNGANSFNGSFYGQFFGTSFTGGSFSGDGSGLLNLNASQISEGAFPASSLGNAWRIIGNSGTTSTNFIGTTDNQALEFRVANLRAFRLEPDPRGAEAANIVGGHPSNQIEGPDSGGSVIVGGGYAGGPNIIRSNSSGVFIGAGSANVIGPNANDVVIVGGNANRAQSFATAIGGGYVNFIETNAPYTVIGGGTGNRAESAASTIGGGYYNLLQTNSTYSTIGGGANNELQSDAPFSTISGGWLNRIRVTADQSTIAGGNANQIYPGARESFIGGGFANLVYSNAANAVIGGGAQNIINNAGVATIGGGVGNTNTGYAATIAGGFFNTAANNGAAVGGGGNNAAFGFNSVVAGGNSSIATAEDSAIGGGHQNTNSGYSATIGGGYQNQATTFYATVPGGFLNVAGGFYSQAAGRQAKAIHNGTFVWADSTAADFTSIANNEFAVRANGGARFVTGSAGMTLNGQPVLTAGATNALTLNNPANTISGTFNGNGTGLTSLDASQLSSGTVPTAALNNAWKTIGNTGTTPGANFLGTTDNQSLEFKVNGSRALRLEPADTPSGLANVIGGSLSNQVISGARGATIAGGGSAFVGDANIVSGDLGAIGGGRGNLVSVAESVVTGGRNNTANAFNASVGGGFGNTASADYAVVPGGLQNTAAGANALAAGRQAKANHAGAFVWADNQAVDFASSGANQFLIRATGGVGINTTNPVSPLHVAGNARVEGLIQLGSGTNTAQPPDKALLIRRLVSSIQTVGNVAARTDKLTLERDGTSAGWRIVNQATPGNTTIAATGLTATGTTVNSVLFIPNAAAAGTNVVFTDAQNVVSFRCSFGDSYSINHMTEVSLARYTGDFYWTGTATSTFNQ